MSNISLFDLIIIAFFTIGLVVTWMWRKEVKKEKKALRDISDHWHKQYDKARKDNNDHIEMLERIQIKSTDKKNVTL